MAKTIVVRKQGIPGPKGDKGDTGDAISGIGADGTKAVANAATSGGIAWIKEAYINPWDPRWGLVFDGTTNDSPAIQAMHDALPADGGKILLPAGHGLLSSKITVSKPLVLFGAGSGTSTAGGATILDVAAGVTGIELATACAKPHLGDFYLRSLSTVAGTDDGILVKATRTILENLMVQGFGRHGVSADTTGGGNANVSQFRSVRAFQCKGDGFHTEGVDSNLITFISTDAANCEGWGYWSDSSTLLFLAPHATANTLGAYYDDGNSNVYIDPYSEGGTGDNVTFDTGSSSIYWRAGGYTSPTITNNGAASNQIFLSGESGDRDVRDQRLRHNGYIEVYRTAAQLNSSFWQMFNGAESFSRMRWFGTGEMQWGDGTATADTSLRRAAAGIFFLKDAVRMPERADPPAPGANDGIIYMRDNGSGKTQLCVRFNTGAVQVIATEP